MISDALQKWSVVIFIVLVAVQSQMPMMPMPYGYGPVMMPPPPQPMAMPVPVPVAIPIPYQEPTTTTTTTTTEKSNGGGSDGDMQIPIAIPLPVPHFVQIAIPSFQPPNCNPNEKGKNGNGKNNNKSKNCPPCPPCSCNPCTPSFFSFCSPCHQQCRCKNGKENPSPQPPNPPQPIPGPAFPMPIPMPGPPPVVIVPFPPQFSPQQPEHTDCESHSVSASCSEEKHYDSCENGGHRKKKRKKNKKNKKKSGYDIYRRRNFGFRSRDRESRDTGLVKPVLTYMSRNGDIKMKRRLSNDEANALIGEGEYRNVRLIAGEDSENKPRVVVMSEPGMRSTDWRRHMVVEDGSSQHVLGRGRKELVFRPTDNKKISNLSVSFQISK